MSRIRGIDDGYKEIKEADPGTALTKTALRRLVTTGIIPSVRIGAKYLFDLDQVELYMSGRLQVVPPLVAAQGQIRRVV